MSRTVRFVHAADLHLDAPFRGVDAAHPAVREALLRSTYEALDRVIQACIDEQVDFLVIAGDLYNSRDKSLRAQIAFQRATERLAEADIPVLVARGNHDPLDGWSAGLEFPETVHLFPPDRVGRFELVRDGELVAAVYGRSFPTSIVRDNLARGFGRGPDDPIAIAVLHANVGGREGHEAYAPCTTDDLRAARMDYWALGHIHKPERVLDEPVAEYAGSTQGMTPRERGVHGCLLVEIDGGIVSSRQLPTCSVVWDREDIDVSETGGLGEVRSLIDDACARARENAGGRPAVTRLDLSGRGPIHAELGRTGVLAELLEDVRDAQMGFEPWVWVDRLRDITSLAIDLDAVRGGQDLAADLVGIVDEVLADEDAVDELLAGVLGPLETKIGALEGLDGRDLLERARDVVLDRFAGGEGT